MYGPCLWQIQTRTEFAIVPIRIGGRPAEPSQTHAKFIGDELQRGGTWHLSLPSRRPFVERGGKGEGMREEDGIADCDPNIALRTNLTKNVFGKRIQMNSYSQQNIWCECSILNPAWSFTICCPWLSWRPHLSKPRILASQNAESVFMNKVHSLIATSRTHNNCSLSPSCTGRCRTSAA